MQDVVRHPAKPAARAQQPAKTLVRTSVKRPAGSLKSRTKVQAPAAGTLAKATSAALVPKPSASRIDEQRLKLAKHIPKSKLVSRFGTPQAHAAAPLVASTITPVATQFISRPAVPPSKKTQTTADILQRALEHANSHTQPAVHSKRLSRRSRRSKQITGISAIAISMTLLIVLAGPPSLTHVKLKMASAKAGFSASLPDYQPAGYSLAHLNYSLGTVAIQYQSNSDNRAYAITEKTSSWDSQGLRDSFVAPQDTHYQAVQSAGRTVYIYGDNASNATWVSNGIWYQVEGNGSLSSRQLVSLASSI